MKKNYIYLTLSLLTMLCLSGCTPSNTEATAVDEITEEATTDTVDETDSSMPSGNYTDEMKIPYTVDLDEYGADSVEREGDHEDSPYYVSHDYYNMEDTDTLSIITNFKTQQQTSEWSCGLSSTIMVLDYYDALDNNNEETLAAMRATGTEPGATTLIDVVNIFESLGFETDSSYDHPGDELYEYMTLDMIQENIANDTPIAIAWNDWGGHWQVIIGYDTLGTETYSDDVIIVADSYDTTDHNQDGYGVYPAERFYYNFTMYDFFTKKGIEESDLLFCIATPTETE